MIYLSILAGIIALILTATGTWTLSYLVGFALIGLPVFIIVVWVVFVIWIASSTVSTPHWSFK